MTKAQINKDLAAWRARLAQEDAKLKQVNAVRQALSKQRSAAEAKIALLTKELRKGKSPRQSVVHGALGFVGTVEHPAGSNTGPRIDEWQKRFGIHAEPWCGAFAGAMIEIYGHHQVDRGVVYTPNIKVFGENGTGGFNKFFTDASQARAGDLVLFDFGGPMIEHVGIVRQQGVVGNAIRTVEGNTSFGDGSQANGGCVAARTRDLGLVAGFARWWT